MMRQLSTKLFSLGLILALFVGVVGTSAAHTPPPNPTALPAQEDTPPVIECEHDLSGETLGFYHFGDLSGPYAFITQPALAGFEDAINYLNENGGVCGAEVVSEYRDTAAEGAAVQAAWDEFSARDNAYLVYLYLPQDSELLRDQIEAAQIPVIAATGSTLAMYGEDGNSPGWAFSAVPLFHDQLGAFCDYVSQNWDSFGIDGDPVIGHVSWLGFGEDTDTDASRAYCENVGVGYAGAQYYFPGIPDISTQIQRVRDEGANILYTTSLTSGPAQLASTLEAMELRDQVMVAGPNWVLDTSVINLGGDAVVGMIGQLPYIWWDDLQHPGIQFATAYWAENRLATADDPQTAFALRNVAYLLAWASVDLYREVLILALNDVGGLDNLSGEAVFEVLTSDRRFEPLQGMIQVQYGEDRRAPSSTRIGTINRVETDSGAVNYQSVPLSEWIEAPDLRPGGDDAP